MANIGKCKIYENRPKFCQDWPQPYHILPEGCTYSFVGSERFGECNPRSCQENNCCGWPREGGEPQGKPLDPYIGGEPCKHLEWVDEEETEKKADNEHPEVFLGEVYKIVDSLLEDMD